MNKILLVLLCVLLLACGGSDSGNPAAPNGGPDDPGPVTLAVNPFVGSWTVAVLEITTPEGQTMSMNQPNVSGSAVFDSTTLTLAANLFGVPTVQEAGSYTFDSTAIMLVDQATGESKTWNYSIASNLLTLDGSRNAGGELLGIKITANR